jgi:hypothetical protein
MHENIAANLSDQLVMVVWLAAKTVNAPVHLHAPPATRPQPHRSRAARFQRLRMRRVTSAPQESSECPSANTREPPARQHAARR